MSKENQDQSKTPGAIQLTAIAAILVAVLYAIQFANTGIGGPERWAQFGDYFGGLMNPIVALAALWLLAANLSELRKSNEELREANRLIAMELAYRSAKDLPRFTIQRHGASSAREPSGSAADRGMTYTLRLTNVGGPASNLSVLLGEDRDGQKLISGSGNGVTIRSGDTYDIKIYLRDPMNGFSSDMAIVTDECIFNIAYEYGGTQGTLEVNQPQRMS